MADRSSADPDHTDSDTASSLLRSPLHSKHGDEQATMGPFGGWQMPISYAGGGVVAEHRAVRNTVGLFDVSHLGKATVRGPGAADFVNACLTADLARIAPGQAQYTLCCTEAGGVIDDMLAYLVSADEVFLAPNAANTAAVVAALRDAAPAAIEVVNQHRDFGLLAVQGPESAAVLREVGLPTDMDYMAFVDTEFDGSPIRVGRTGYTGEHGYELLPRWEATAALWDALLPAVRARDGLPAGLGARDTLRLEAGLSLHGQDLSPEISPLQARSSWAVGWKKDSFFGRAALLAEKEAGPRRRMRGLVALDRGVLRPRQDVIDGSGATIGHTTSGTFAPTLGHAIALALLDTAAGVSDGDELTVSVRGRPLRVRVTKPPFVPSHVR